MLSKDQINTTQNQLFTAQAVGLKTPMASQNANISSLKPNMRAGPTVIPSAPNMSANKFQCMTQRSQVNMSMSLNGSKPSFSSKFAPAPTAAVQSAFAPRSSKFMMLAGNTPSMSASNNNSKFMAPQMVASTPRQTASYGFGGSLQHSANVVQNHRAGTVKMQATATDAEPTVRNLDIMSFTEARPQGTAKIDNIDEKGKAPNNTYRPKEPFVGKVVSNTTLTGPDAGEVCHVVFETDGKLPYAEGQSIGIVADGTDEKGNPHKLRLYSIASSAPGDYGDGNTVSLCVKRLIYENDEGKEVRGVCSNYICDLKEGADVKITGPVGQALLLPKDPKANIIMLATGTGIAPFRSFLWRFFFEKHDDYKFDGNAWLFMGVPTTSALLYDNEFKKMKELGGDKFRYDYAISREQTDKDGNKMYIQNRMAEYGQELWDLMQKDNTYVYMCGLKGMESGIQEALGEFAKKNGVEWTDFVKTMKKAGRYHVEVY